MIKKTILLVVAFLSAVQLNAQIDSLARVAVADTAWKVGGNFGLQFNQAAYSNWQAGGVNSISGNGLLSMFANYDKGGRWSWSNRLDVGYGLNYIDTLFNKTDDRLELQSRVDRMISDHWSLSGLLNFRTQFTNGYAEPGGDSVISTFMAPGYLITGIGFTYKPTEKFSAFLSPLTSKMTFVQDDNLAAEGAFGVDPGSNFRQEIGGYANLTYRSPLVENVNLETRLSLYSNYLEGNYKYVDVNGELLLFMKINEFLTANVAFNVIYDHDIIFDTNEDGRPDGPRTQFKEVIGVGLAYQFGYKPKEKK